MNQHIKFFLLVSLCFLFLGGCTPMQQAARDVGRPVGGIARVPQCVSEGAAEGYVGDSNLNPYGR